MKTTKQETSEFKGTFSEDEYLEFMEGERIPCRSSNVAWAQWDEARQVLLLGYHSGSVYRYQPCGEQMAIEFCDAPSKGKWRWATWPKGNGGVSKVS